MGPGVARKPQEKQAELGVVVVPVIKRREFTAGVVAAVAGAASGAEKLAGAQEDGNGVQGARVPFRCEEVSDSRVQRQYISLMCRNPGGGGFLFPQPKGKPVLVRDFDDQTVQGQWAVPNRPMTLLTSFKLPHDTAKFVLGTPLLSKVFPENPAIADTEELLKNRTKINGRFGQPFVCLAMLERAILEHNERNNLLSDSPVQVFLSAPRVKKGEWLTVVDCYPSDLRGALDNAVKLIDQVSRNPDETVVRRALSVLMEKDEVLKSLGHVVNVLAFNYDPSTRMAQIGRTNELGLKPTPIAFAIRSLSGPR